MYSGRPQKHRKYFYTYGYGKLILVTVGDQHFEQTVCRYTNLKWMCLCQGETSDYNDPV